MDTLEELSTPVPPAVNPDFLPPEQRENLTLLASQVFRPSAPIDDKELFAGRLPQVQQVIDAINQPGQHAIIYGERGVGKTSLANVLSAYLRGTTVPILAPRVNCDAQDTYTKVWRKVFDQISLSRQVQRIGIGASPEIRSETVADSFGNSEIAPADIQKQLVLMSTGIILIIIIDEFDRLNEDSDRELFADTIKTLSDNLVRATLVLVGVAETVNELIHEHASVERALSQVRMPPMSKDELSEIVTKGLARLHMKIAPEALRSITLLSRGLPHYTHLLALNASRQAIEAGTRLVGVEHISVAVDKAISQAQQSLRNAYFKAVASPRKNIYPEVLLACAMAEVGDDGCFAPADVREPIRLVTQRDYDIPSFSRHLNDFCEDTRGKILKRIGAKHHWRYRFVNPMIRPYIIMQGISDKKVSGQVLEKVIHQDG